MDYREAESQLAPLESFDAAAFLAGGDAPQDLCDFVLALALVYNDYRDVLLAHVLLMGVEPQDTVAATPPRALANGLRTTLFRVQAGVVHELFNVINESAHVMEEPLFDRVIRTMSKEGREAWRSLLDAAAGRGGNDPLARALLLVRNKVAFHYDARQLGAGYELAFGAHHPAREPMLCRGRSLLASRFCFADAAAQSYLFQKTQAGSAQELLDGASALSKQLHHALFEIATRFIQARRFAWRRAPASRP